MDPIELEPKYSTNDITGRCLRCLAEQQLKDCILDMLSTDKDIGALQNKYEALVAFLQSPKAQSLIDETERLLSEGAQVKVRLSWENGDLNYSIILESESSKKEVQDTPCPGSGGVPQVQVSPKTGG
jgi:hypothetical protein